MKKNIPICLPKLPSTEQITSYLYQIDQNRWYTNFGPLVIEFLFRLAKLFNVCRSEITCATNGTLLLELCLKAFNVQKASLCIMPSWTFVATPLAAVNAKMEPFFIDVDLKKQTIDPLQLEQMLPAISQKGIIGAVIVVAPFGMPVNIKEWDDFTSRTGIPVLIDAAAAFDTILKLKEMAVSTTPIMVSLHATKVLGIGEGAILLSKNVNLINLVEKLTQFGFPKGIRNAELHGTNAKLSEYSAAVGLAALDNWKNTCTAWRKINDYYQNLLENANIQHLLSHKWETSTCNVVLPYQADLNAEELIKMGIMARKWWSDGCHHQFVFKQAMSLNLTNTEFLSKSILGLPFYIGMSQKEINFVVDSLKSLGQRFKISYD